MMPPFNAMALGVAPGPMVLEASAGTGKTFAVVQLAVRILLGDTAVRSRGPRHLLLVTFTKAATAELKERLRAAIRAAEAIAAGRRAASDKEEWITELLDRLGDDAGPRITAVVGRLDELAVTTIHGFCVGVLEEFPHECGVTGELEFQDDDADLIVELLDDAIRRATWTNPWQAAGMVALKADRAGLLKVVRVISTHGHTVVEPTPDPATHLAAFQANLEEARTIWDRHRVEGLMNAVTWHETGSLSLPDVRATVLDGIDALLRGEPTGLAMLDWFEAESLWKAMRKRGDQKPPAEALRDDPGVVALQQAVAAVEPWLAHLRTAIASEIAARLPTRKAADGVATFSDQIRLVSEALGREGGAGRLATALHDRFDAVLVDEAQDTDPAQWTIFRNAFRERPLIIVGDPKQAIYGWRGADLRSYLDTRREAGEDRIAQLDRNWRSAPRLVHALEQLFTRAEEPFGVSHDDMPFIPVRAARDDDHLSDPVSGAPLRWMVDPELSSVDDVRTRIRRRVVEEIVRLVRDATLGTRKLAPRDIAVLVRKNADADVYCEALKAVGINAVVSGVGDVTASAAWSEVLALLEAVSNPTSDYALKSALATLLAGVPAELFARWQADALDGEVEQWRQRIGEAAERADRQGAFVALSWLLGECDAVTRLAALPGGERRLTDLRHVLELVQEAEQEVGGHPIRLVQWMMHWPEASSNEGERRQLRLESDSDAVEVRTVHGAKGLEWPIVFVPTCWDGKSFKAESPILVRRNGEWHAVFDHSDGYSMAAVAAGNISWQEELRLCYVALTRARSRCYVALGCGASQNVRGPLGWLLRPPGADPDGRPKDEFDAVVRGLEELVAASNGTMDLVEGSGDVARSPTLPDASAVSIVPRLDPPRNFSTWRITSYTRLVEGRDADSDVTEPVVVVDRTPRTDLDLLPPGATTGVAIHRIFELLDFDASPSRIRATTRDVLGSLGILTSLAADARDRVVTATSAAVERVLSVPVPGWGFPLAAVPRQRTLREWGFNLSLDGFNLGAIAARLRAEGGWKAAYADQVDRLAPAELRGFLTGVIDLVFERDGCWYIVDWKSNHLGSAPGAYAPEALLDQMTRHHYVLQYELYREALGRYLGRRGGAAPVGVGYVFVRGWAAEPGGWCVDGVASPMVQDRS